MSNFFDSEIIQNELKELNKLEKEVYERTPFFGTMNKEEKVIHVHKLSELLEKQQIMYTRLSLSDDPKAIKMKENVKESLVRIGYSSDIDVRTVFSNMSRTLEKMKSGIGT